MGNDDRRVVFGLLHFELRAHLPVASSRIIVGQSSRVVEELLVESYFVVHFVGASVVDAQSV